MLYILYIYILYVIFINTLYVFIRYYTIILIFFIYYDDTSVHILQCCYTQFVLHHGNQVFDGFLSKICLLIKIIRWNGK